MVEDIVSAVGALIGVLLSVFVVAAVASIGWHVGGMIV